MNVTDKITAEYGVEMDRRNIIYSFIHYIYIYSFASAC